MEIIIKEAGNRLDKALADLTELSRSQANEAIKAGTEKNKNGRFLLEATVFYLE